MINLTTKIEQMINEDADLRNKFRRVAEDCLADAAGDEDEAKSAFGEWLIEYFNGEIDFEGIAEDWIKQLIWERNV